MVRLEARWTGLAAAYMAFMTGYHTCWSNATSQAELAQCWDSAYHAQRIHTKTVAALKELKSDVPVVKGTCGPTLRLMQQRVRAMDAFMFKMHNHIRTFDVNLLNADNTTAVNMLKQHFYLHDELKATCT